MNWTLIRKALYDWASLATGVPVTWANQEAPRLAYPFAVLDVLAEAEVGVDDLRYSAGTGADTGKLVPSVAGNRRVTFSLTVHALAPGDAATAPTPARDYVTTARTALRLPTNRTRFAAAGLALVSASDTASLDGVSEGKRTSIAALDVTFNASINMADTAVEYIESTHITGTGDDDVVIDQDFGVGS